MRRPSAGGVVLAVAAILFAVWLAPAAALTQTRNVVARDSQGHLLGVDPVLLPGEHVQLTITGFAPGATLTVKLGRATKLSSATMLASATADGSGRARFTIVVPATLATGSYDVVVVGSPAFRTLTPTPVKATGTKDHQGVEAVVPNLAVFAFRIKPATSTSPSTPSSPTGPPTSPTSPTHGASGTSASTGGGTVGHTGVDVLLLVVVGAVGVVGGSLILLPGRRRKHA